MSSAAIPTSTSVVESAVIKAPLSHVWHFIKRATLLLPLQSIQFLQREHPQLTAFTVQDFKNFWSALKSSEFVESQKETDVVKWTFTDGTVLEVKQEEHSVSTHSLRHS